MHFDGSNNILADCIVTDTSMADASPVGEAGEEEGFARPRHTSSCSSGSSEGNREIDRHTEVDIEID